MIFLPLALLLMPEQKPPQKPQRKPEVAGAVVAMEDRAITLPQMPRDGAQGRAEFKEVHAQIGRNLDDLNLSLVTLYGRQDAGALPTNLSVPSELAEAGRALVRVIDDPDYLRLERAYLDTWKGWQAAMVETGLATRAQASPKAAEPTSKQYVETKRKAVQLLRTPSRGFKEVGRLDAGYRSESEDDTFSLQQLGSAPMGEEERSVNLAKFTNNDNQNRNRLAVTDLLLPDLGETWNALSNHLNDAALSVANRAQDPDPRVDATMAALHTHAKIAVLERFRKALYYCDLVWCQIASKEPPPPPKRLVRTGTAHSRTATAP